MRLDKDFYRRDGLTVARELVGKILVREINGQQVQAKIVETEAYLGPEDKACHAYNNKRTERTETMFAAGGVAYIYRIYGIYNLLNVVANDEGVPEAALIRAVEPISGLDLIKEQRGIESNQRQDLTNGPGKLGEALAIEKSLDGYDLINGSNLYIIDSDEPVEIENDKRINIDYAEEYKDRPWRFYIAGNSFISQ